MVSSAFGMQTPLFPHKEREKKITDAHTQHIKCDKLQWKVMKNMRKARLNGWIARFDLSGFLVEFFNCIIHTVWLEGEKQIAISVNYTRIMQSVTNQGETNQYIR